MPHGTCRRDRRVAANVLPSCRGGRAPSDLRAHATYLEDESSRKAQDFAEAKITKTEHFDIGDMDSATIIIAGLIHVGTGSDGGVNLKLVESVEGPYTAPNLYSGAVAKGVKIRADFELPPGAYDVTGDSTLRGMRVTFSPPAGTIKHMRFVRVLVIKKTVYFAAVTGSLRTEALPTGAGSITAGFYLP